MAGEPLAAPVALVVKRRRRRVGIGVRALMLSHVGQGAEVLAADGAQVRLETQMAFAMLPQQVALLEHLPEVEKYR